MHKLKVSDCIVKKSLQVDTFFPAISVAKRLLLLDSYERDLKSFRKLSVIRSVS